MKNRIYFVITLVLGVISANAQSPSSSRNFVMETVVKIPGKSTITDLNGLTVAEANRTIHYMDGLGRPQQTVQWMASPTQKDIVQLFEYDAFGREIKKYLPYAEETSDDLSYKSAASTNQSTYYGVGSWDANIIKTPYPYSLTLLQPSPLNKVTEQGAPGAVWQPYNVSITGSGHTVRLEYTFNTTNEVALWTTTSSGAEAISNYAANKLIKEITKDENWLSGKAGITETFKDQDGHVVLKRIWETNTKSLSTYYVYDELGNLRYVLPPAVNENGQATLTSFIESDAAFKQFIYGYQYDEKHRLVEKKIPGKKWEYMIYNVLDQVIFTQDGNQRLNNKWLFTKYDAFGRTIITGIYTNNISRAALQTTVDGMSTVFEGREVNFSTDYTNNSMPTNNYSLLSINYYDDYVQRNVGIDFPSSSLSVSNHTKGLLTYTRIWQTDGSTSVETALYYDVEGRLIETVGNNQLGGTERIINTYNFAGELLTTTRNHVVSSNTTTILNTFLYDHIGRKISTKEKINSQAEVVLNKFDYNEVGQLKEKHLHSIDDGASFYQHTQFAYNERGWMKNSTSNEFSMQLKYNDAETGTSANYNGNISNQLWGTSSSFPHIFKYTYDPLNRLTDARTTAGTSMIETITYDVMGNILEFNRDDQGVGIYHYAGNQLSYISGGPLSTFPLAYDDNGNAIKSTVGDSRTEVSLTYNYLNLPLTVTDHGINLAYTYDATGKKLKKVNSVTSTTTNYVDGIEYTNGAIDFIKTEEGRALNSSGTYTYQYNLTDHLGNVRYSFDIYSGAVRKLQEDDYYAFGKRKIATGGSNNYLYNGKEIQDELGQYDYGARFYDPVIGRWNVVDPKAQLLEMSSPYVYALNSPSSFIDKDGELPIYIGGKTSNDSERNSRTYWDAQLLATIAGSGIPNPGHTSMFVDGNRYLYNFAGTKEVRHSGFTEGQTAEGRRNAGYEVGKSDFKKILSQLERDPKTGKITEKIQIYTHSRGAAFGAGYTEALLEMIKQNSDEFADAVNEIDYVLNMAPHQSDAIDSPKGSNSFSIDHTWDMLSGDDMGNNIGFKTNTKSGSPGLSHQNKTFSKEVGAFIKSFQKSKGDNSKLIDDFVKQMRSYGIKVTVN